MQSSKQEIMVEIAYALPHAQKIIPIKAHEGITAEEAILQSSILQQYPDIDLTVNKIGLFGKLTRLDTPLRHMDRVEIYRNLIADPKEVRKQRAAEGKIMRKGGGDLPGE